MAVAPDDGHLPAAAGVVRELITLEALEAFFKNSSMHLFNAGLNVYLSERDQSPPVRT